MIEILKQIENDEILGLLANRDNFKSIDIDYHPPRVERIWTQLREYRLCFHVLHPCNTEEALYHPHPWPSVIHQLHGEYEMGITHSKNKEFHLSNNSGQWNDHLRGQEACKIQTSGSMYYEMMDLNGFHYVRPITKCMSVMLMDKPFVSPSAYKNPPTKKLKELSEVRIEQIRLWFYDHYANI